VTRFDVRESLFLTGRGRWVVGVPSSGVPVVGDELVVAHSGARVRVQQVADGGARLLLDDVVAAGAVLVGVGDPVPDVPAPAAVPPGPVHVEVQFVGSIPGRGPVLGGLLRRGTVEAGDVLAVVGSGATVRVRSVELHRTETVDGVRLGLHPHPDDAGQVAEGAVLVSLEGER
jgi:selenocysteine-specific translation elongation factor